mgnify:CR=1 FL=1
MKGPAALTRRRREMAAAYARAARRHEPRADLARTLIALTCQLLKAEIRAARTTAREPGPQPDLFEAAPRPTTRGSHEDHRQQG